MQLRCDGAGTGMRPWEPPLGLWQVGHAVVSVRHLCCPRTGELDQVAAGVLVLTAVAAPPWCALVAL